MEGLGPLTTRPLTTRPLYKHTDNLPFMYTFKQQVPYRFIETTCRLSLQSFSLDLGLGEE